MEIDAVPAILELVAEGYGYAVLSPRALHGSAQARRLHSRTIVQPQLKSALAIVTSALRPVDAALEGRDRDDRGVGRARARACLKRDAGRRDGTSARRSD